MASSQTHQGEPFGYVGQLKNNNVVTTDFNVSLEIYCLGQKVATLPCTLNTTASKYVVVVNTENLLGNLLLRFVVSTASGRFVKQLGFIEKTIYQ